MIWLIPLLKTALMYVLRALGQLALMLLGPTVLGWIVVGLMRQVGRMIRWNWYHQLVDRISIAWGISQ